MVFRYIIIAIFFASNCYAQEENWDYQQFFEIADGIQRNFPPFENIYVGVGTSPVIVTAMLKLRGARAINLPLSESNRWFHVINENDHYKEILWEHFSNFLPAESNKSIVLIDFSKKGTILKVQEMINEYLLENGILYKTEVAVLAKEKHKKNFLGLPEKSWYSISEDLPSIYEALNDHDYSMLAEWEQFPVPMSHDYLIPKLNQNHKPLIIEPVRDFLINKGIIDIDCSVIFE